MLDQVRGLLAPPTFADDEDKTRVAGLLNIMLLTLIALGLIFVPVTLVIGDYYVGVTASMVVLSALAAVLWVWARRGHTWSAGYVLTASLFVTGIAGICIVGSIRAPIASVLIVTAIVASVLVGNRGTTTFTLLGLVALLALWWAEAAGLLVPYVHQQAGFSSWLTWAIVLISISILLSLSTRSLDRALGRARSGEQALAHTNRQLRAEIAERMRTEAALRESEERYRGLVEASPDAIVMTDAKAGRILICNDQTIEMLGCDDESEVVGRTLISLVPEKERQRAIDTGYRTLETGSLRSAEYHMHRKDGTLFHSELSGSVIQDEQGTPTAFVAVLRDITERKQVAEALQRRTEQLSTLNEIGRVVSAVLDVRSTLDAIFQQVQRSIALDTFYVCLYDAGTNRLSYPLIYDGGVYYDEPDTVLDDDAPAGRAITTATPTLINRSTEELAAMTGSGRFVGDTARVSASLLFAPLEVGQQVIGAISAQSYTPDTYNDEHLEFLAGVAYQAAIALENARLYDEVRRYAGELETRVAERTAELAAVNKELEAFAYSVSHDLRAPLRAMDAFSGILLEEYAPLLPDEGQLYLGRIGSNARRMDRLIKDLLAFSRLGRQALHKQTVQVKELAGQVLEDLAPDLEDRQVEVVIDDLPLCQADPALLKQVYANLLSNAIKFTREREAARIRAGWLQQDEETVYFVRDNGVGFDMRYADKLFSVFQRLHGAEEYEGTGAGLAIVQRIVHRHGGRVWAEAEEDKGATFYFTLG